MPTVSPRSRTIRWRKPPRTIAAAASSSDQSGAANTTSRVRWSATSSRSGSCPAPSETQDVALGDDPRAVAVGVDHDRRADPALGHQPRDRAQRVAGPDREDHRAHAFANLHARSRSSQTLLEPAAALLPIGSERPPSICNDCLNLLRRGPRPSRSRRVRVDGGIRITPPDGEDRRTEHSPARTGAGRRMSRRRSLTLTVVAAVIAVAIGIVLSYAIHWFPVAGLDPGPQHRPALPRARDRLDPDLRARRRR